MFGDSQRTAQWVVLVIYHNIIWASLVAQLVENPPAMQETLVQFLGSKICWRRDRLPTPVFLAFLCGSAGKKSTCNAGDLGSIPRLGRSPAEGKATHSSVLACTVHGVAKTRTQLSHFFTFSFILLRVYLQARGVILHNSHCLGSIFIFTQYKEERSLSLSIINRTALGELRLLHPPR